MSLNKVVYLGICLKFFNISEVNAYSVSTEIFNFHTRHRDLYNYFFVDSTINEQKYFSLPVNVSFFIEKLNIKDKSKIDLLRRAIELLYNSNNADVDKIISALNWAFESEANQDQTLQFIQKCIGLEAILGDGKSNNENVVITLTNRCAYMLSSDHGERRELISQFKKIYDLRSKLIHGSKPHLASTEIEMLFEADRILKQIIYKELIMLLQ